MKQRWLPVGVLAAVLFATNVVARWAVKLFSAHDSRRTTEIGVVALAVVAVVMAAAAFRWASRYRMSRAVADTAAGAFGGCVLTVLLAPLLVATTPVADGADFLIGQVWRYLALAAGGVVFGLLVTMALGRDHKSRSWKAYAERYGSKPKRPVRR